MLSMKSIRFLGFIALLCCVGFCLAQEDESTINDSNVNVDEQTIPIDESYLAVNSVIDNGNLIKFPFFSEEHKEIDPELKSMHVKQMNEMLSYLIKVVGDELDKAGSIGMFGWLKVGKNLVSMGYSQRNERLKLKKQFPLEKQFNTEMAAMFKRLMAESKKRASIMPKENRNDLKIKLTNFLESLKKSVELSQVGPYIKYEDGSINEVRFFDVASDIMASLRLNGFDKFLSALETLMNVIAMFK